MHDTDAADLSPFFDSSVLFVEEARKEGNCVLVHCQQGVSRSAALVIAFLIKSEKHTLSSAYTHLRAQRPTCKVRPNFLKQLIEWDKKLKPGEKGAEEKVKIGENHHKRKEAGECGSGNGEGKQKENGGVCGSNKIAKGPMGPQLPPSRSPPLSPVEENGNMTPSSSPVKRPLCKGPQLPDFKVTPASDPAPAAALPLDPKAAFFARKERSWGSTLPGL